MPRHSFAPGGFVLLCVLAGLDNPRAASDLTWFRHSQDLRADVSSA